MCLVLIIEDDVIAAADIQDTLASQGATSFRVAETEREAIRAAHEARPALITCDVMLASGSGPSAIRAIRAALGAVPVIYVTATPDQCARDGDDPIVEKPFDALRLAALFRSLAPA